MKQPTVETLIPTFVKNFQCVADQCDDHCCHSWNISVDKKSFKNLKKANNIVVKKLANTHLKLTRNSSDNWGEIKMQRNGNCPFLDQKSLCQIHSTLGHSALSPTCQDYPRAFFSFGQQVEASLSISCPTAAKEVLFNPSAMMFEPKNQPLSQLNNGNIGGFNEASLPKWMPILRDSCFAIVLFEELTLEKRLFAIGMLLKRAQETLHDLAKLQQLIQSVETMVTDGSFNNMFEKIPPNDTLKWLVFSHQDKVLHQGMRLVLEGEQHKLSRSSERFDQCRQTMFTLFNNKMNEAGETADPAIVFNQILTQGKPYLDSYLTKNQHILVNYIIYYLYHNQFMVNQNKSLFEFFTIMSVDLFLLKSYLSAIALAHEELTDEWLLQLFQSYSRRRQHESNFVQSMQEQLKKSGTEGVAILALLKS